MCENGDLEQRFASSLKNACFRLLKNMFEKLQPRDFFDLSKAGRKDLNMLEQKFMVSPR